MSRVETIGDAMTFPDTLPKLSARERARVNDVLRSKLADLLGWSRS